MRGEKGKLVGIDLDQIEKMVERYGIRGGKTQDSRFLFRRSKMGWKGEGRGSLDPIMGRDLTKISCFECGVSPQVSHKPKA